MSMMVQSGRFAAAGGGSGDAGIPAAMFATLSGTTVTVRDQKGFSTTVSNVSAGRYSFAFSSAEPDTDYFVLAQGRPVASAVSRPSNGNVLASTKTVNGFDIVFDVAAAADPESFSVVVFRASALGAKFLAAWYATTDASSVPTLVDSKNIASFTSAGGSPSIHEGVFTSALPNDNYFAFGGGGLSGAWVTPPGTGTGASAEWNTTDFNTRNDGIVSTQVGGLAFDPTDPPPGTIAAVVFTDAGTAAIQGQTNVTSISEPATAVYGVNFTTPPADAFYGTFVFLRQSSFRSSESGPVNNTTAGYDQYDVNGVEIVGVRSASTNLDAIDKGAVWCFKPSLL